MKILLNFILFINLGYENIAELLIGKGANVNLADNSKSTALHWASEDGKLSSKNPLGC